MSERNYDEMVSDAVDTVLETMFFSTPVGWAEPETGAAVFEACVLFRGQPSGALSVRLSSAGARALAASFLGEDEETLTEAQPGEVVCELANMLCGSLVSRLANEDGFDLAAPELPPAGADGLKFPVISTQSFELDNGILTVSLALEAMA